MNRQENAAFISFENKHHGLVFDDIQNEKYPITYYNVINGLGYISKNDCSYYGFVYDGQTEVEANNINKIVISKGMYFSFAGQIKISHRHSSKIILIEVYHTKGVYPETNFRALNTIGGRIETEGRLKYIDGCTDSVLINPVKMGDPCLNHLHFPKNITQTPHTHPTHRIGIVAKGNGTCITPFGNLPLVEGMIFVIKAWDGKTYAKGLDGKEYEIGNHCFYTTDSEMDVIAFHPDSDFGAQDENHPMINRTIVKGIPASKIDKIKTK